MELLISLISELRLVGRRYSLLLAGTLHVCLMSIPSHVGLGFWALWRGWSLYVVAAAHMAAATTIQLYERQRAGNVQPTNF
jgi:hypothetical protein